MNARRTKSPIKRQLEATIDKIGGEAIESSGSKDKMPYREFSGAVLLDSTFVRVLPNTSQ